MDSLATPLLRLAVVPSPDSAQEVGAESYFSRGFVEDLITDLSRFPQFGIISPRSSFSADYQDMSDREIAVDLHSDFLLKTSVRKRGRQIRINAQLVNPATGGVLWAERYDAPEEEVFALQDSLVEKVVAALSLQIDAVTLDAARRKPMTELESYDCWLRGLEKLREGSIATDEEAREYFERAIEIDPHCARAYVGLSLSHFNEWSCQNWDLSEASECRAFQYASHATQLDRSDAVAHLVLGRVHLFRREFEKAGKHINLAFQLNPNDADQLVQIASCKTFLGEHDAAAQIFDRALALNPHCDPWYYAYGGFITIMRRDFERGIEMALKAPLTSVWIDLSAYLAIAHAYSGNPGEAAVYRKVFEDAYQEKIAPGRPPESGESFQWLIDVSPFAASADHEFYRNGLILAGFAEASPPPELTDSPEPQVTGPNERPVFKRSNELRTIVFDGRRAQLPEVKGFRDLEQLLAADREVHCTELMGSISEDGEAGEIMDARARAEYAIRIRELQAELDEAEENHDPARAERVHEELDPLMDHLTKALGLGGRSRKLAAPAERARSAVTWRIRSAIRKIEAAHPSLGRHFENAVRTGTFCSYSPEKPVVWEL